MLQEALKINFTVSYARVF